MHRVTVNVMDVEWDTEGADVELPTQFTYLSVTVDDASDDEQILGAVLDMLTDEYDFLIKNIEYVIVEMTRVEG